MKEEEKKSETNKNGYSRRDFLKIIGASSGAAVAGCAQQPVEKIIPYVNQPDEVVPGVATWYTGTCGECSAGCGVLVRTREGRAVKVEGNPAHPLNKGGLCALGQSSLQTLYDPDRVREPLKREPNGAFRAISWDEALESAAKTLSSIPKGKKAVVLTDPLSGSSSTLLNSFAKKVSGVEVLELELFSEDYLDQAAELVFGQGAKTKFDFSEAETIVSFGAGFLETWVSPVAFSKQWKETRKIKSGKEVSYFVHFEPRLSLTAANADRWLMNRPGTEVALLKALLKAVVQQGISSKASASSKSRIQKAVAGVDIEAISSNAGIKPSEIIKLAKKLKKSSSSIVVAGGASVSGENSVSAAALANLLNAALGNIGKTVKLTKGSSSNSSVKNLGQFIEEINKEDNSVAALLVSGPNLSYLLPENSGFKKGLGNIGTIISHTVSLDETANESHLVLPASTSFESWSDSQPMPGVYAINQPAMQPLYDTLGLGDLLIALGGKLKVSLGADSFHDYIKSQWKKRIGAENFENRWLSFVEKGGDLKPSRASSVAWEVRSVAGKLKEGSVNGLSLLAFPTVRSIDGSTANRPWLQEVPDPLSTSVWGSWIEINSGVAKSRGIKHGDVVQIKTSEGRVEAPAYVTDHIHPDLVASPIGQGHERLGRFAQGVGSNVLSAMKQDYSAAAFAFLTGGASLLTAISRDELVQTQMQEDQMERGILRWVHPDKPGEHLGTGDHGHHGGGHGDDHGDKHGDDHGESDGHGGGHGGHGGHGEPKQMYKQMEHPKHHWGMSIDLSDCTGCSACVVACYAENNVPVVGKQLCAEGREMSWVRVSHYFSDSQTRPVDGFMPVMCQHCGNAPCEPVCPVYATYHNEEGLNMMVYNRCVGTRYCANNCSYKVRRFNWFKYDWPEPLTWQLNPDVTVREVGVMEKCSFCIQRIREVQNSAKNEGRSVQDGEVQPACASSCPTGAISFGDMLDKNSEVSKRNEDERSYKVLDAHLNTQPAVSYMARVVNDESK